MSFEQFNLDPKILSAISETGYTEPTPIQAQAIPMAAEGVDILASAQTGTGKTAAFIVPALQRLLVPSAVARSKGPRVLVLTPTRELAQQVTQSAQTYGKYVPKLSVVSIVGGVPYYRQREKLARFVDIMIATPGRLQDYVNQGRIDFSRLELLILDEADRMLDMGFRDAVKEIVSGLPETRQTLLFSATMDRSITELAAGILKSPKRIQVSEQRAKHDHIEQRLHFVESISAKCKALDHLIAESTVKQAIVFTATKRAADELARSLDQQGVQVGALHGDMDQRARTRTIGQMKDGMIKILVATDVAARGLDVKGITHIINFDLPRKSEDYVHRIGRTGRAGSAGVAITLAYHGERRLVRNIETYTGQRIPVTPIPGLVVSGDASSRGPRPEFRDGPREPRRESSFNRDNREGSRDNRDNGGERREFRGRSDRPRHGQRSDRGPRRDFGSRPRRDNFAPAGNENRTAPSADQQPNRNFQGNFEGQEKRSFGQPQQSSERRFRRDDNRGGPRGNSGDRKPWQGNSGERSFQRKPRSGGFKKGPRSETFVHQGAGK